ncbi:MAG: dephospho-CoA kinase [Desulfobacula sp.]|nr:dephospho-CoA kinase [Desulfobacula sp.]
MTLLKIAVTGSAGSGKTRVCKCFGKIGLATLDCDVIARQIVEPGRTGFSKIVELFGNKVVQKNGELDRAKLRSIIVDDSSLRKKLENILHPRILDEMVSLMEKAELAGKEAVAVEVPLLFESGMDKIFHVTIAVIASSQDLVARIAARDRVSALDAQKILDLQMPQVEKANRADHVIENKGKHSELFESVDNLYTKIEKEFLTI